MRKPVFQRNFSECRYGIRQRQKRIDLLCAFDIRLVVFVGHVDLETLVDIEKVIADGFQGFIVSFQGFEEDRLAFEHFSGCDGICHSLQDEPPRCHVRTGVGSAQKDDAIGRDEDRPGVLLVSVCNVVGVEKSTLDEKTAEAVRHKDDGISGRPLALAVKGEVGD